MKINRREQLYLPRECLNLLVHKYKCKNAQAVTKAGCSKLKLAQTLGKNLASCFSFCISARLFISKRQRRKHLLIRKRFVKKYFQVYKQAVGKFGLNLRLT
jgi:hypothetical protein